MICREISYMQYFYYFEVSDIIDMLFRMLSLFSCT